MNRLPCLALLALLLLPTTDAAAAESYDNCTGYITALPSTISTQGTWCLKQDVATAIATGAALTVATNNVTLDCNDFKIGGLAAGLSTSTSGIKAVSRLNLTVRNCNIRGFRRGIDISGSGHAIVDNRLDNNTEIGIFVSGSGNTIRSNVISETGEMTFDGVTAGISVAGDADIIGNTVATVFSGSGAQQGATGIGVSGSTTSVIQDNLVRNLVGGSAMGIGIAAISGTYAAIEGNDLAVGSEGGGTSTAALYCSGTEAIVVGNRLQGFGTPFAGCDNDGDNLVQP